MANFPTVGSGYSELHCRSGACRKSSGTERSDERALQKTMERERSGERGSQK